MGKLFLVSLIWAFSFPLIGHRLAMVDSYFVGMTRMALSMCVFLPFYRPHALPWKKQAQLAVCGGLQYGLMYIFYLQSFNYLKSHEVALLTVVTPLYATLFNDMFCRKFDKMHFGVACLAVAGVAIIKYAPVSPFSLLKGVVLVQLANITFAFGQMYYRNILKAYPKTGNAHVFAPMYGGALLITASVSLIMTPFAELSITPTQWGVIGYLGVIASGVCFFLWNAGARQVNAGALAIINNLKTPLAMMVAILFFGEKAAWTRLMLGSAIAIGALIINERYERHRTMLALETKVNLSNKNY